MPIRKKVIKYIKDMIVYLKNKINKAKLVKRNLLQAHEDEEISLLYHFRKYNKIKNILPRKKDA